jgi:hypothetical protein
LKFFIGNYREICSECRSKNQPQPKVFLAPEYIATAWFGENSALHIEADSSHNAQREDQVSKWFDVPPASGVSLEKWNEKRFIISMYNLIGTGLNIRAATIMVMVDPPHSRTAEELFITRSVRLG